MYKVYSKIENNIIMQIESEISSNLYDFTDTSIWTQIDEGYGDKYAHAQGNYFPKKKQLIDNQGRYNYKYVDDKVMELTEEEKEKLFSKIEPIQEPTETEILQKQLLETQALVAELKYKTILKENGGI